MGNIQNPLVHSGKIKDILISRFRDDRLIQSLVMPQMDESLSLEENWKLHCHDTAFSPDLISDNSVLLCLETETAYAKTALLQLRLIISVHAAKDMLHMTAEEKQLYTETYGLYGNRIDMITMAIHRHLTEDTDFSRSLGIGQTKLSEDKDPVTSHWRENGCYGKSLIYTIYR